MKRNKMILKYKKVKSLLLKVIISLWHRKKKNNKLKKSNLLQFLKIKLEKELIQEYIDPLFQVQDRISQKDQLLKKTSKRE